MYELNGKPDYKGSRDEIIRADIEDKFTRMITLKECCGETPTVYFQSCHDWFVRCPKCRKQTEMRKHQYEAMQAWNRQEFKKESSNDKRNNVCETQSSELSGSGEAEGEA